MAREKSNECFRENEELWDHWTELHKESKLYDVEAFKKGKSSLNFIELKELGDVSGKELLHLMCHFGLDTLSWARLGAKVTGVDFSRKAIEFAISLKNELGIKADFVHSNIYDLEKALDRKFDIVFTSYGILCWLPDLNKWSQIIYTYLKNGGTFYMIAAHPVLGMLDDNGSFKYPYFHSEEPTEEECKGSYANTDSDFTHVSYQWSHSLSDVINSIIKAGLQIEFIHEFPFSVYGDRPFLKKGADGLWRHRDKNIRIPMMFSIKAEKNK